MNIGTQRTDADELLLGIVHDVRLHLRRAITGAQLFERKIKTPLEPELRAHLEGILAAGKDMNELLGRLAKYAVAGAPLRDQPRGDVAVMLDSALRRLGGKNVDAEIESHALRDSGIETPSSIEAVFGELLDNALKFRDGPIRITMLVEHAGDRHVFGVKDTGIGFDPEFRERIMRPLERLHPAHVYPGCGLGLAICRRTVEGCGGKLWAESKLGQGSAFWFSLPLHQ
jgi:signal transduction histidine kinase